MIFYFILGMLFVSFISPLLDGLTSLILTWFETIKAALSVKIANYNSKIKKLAISEDDNKNVIGFTYENEEEEEDE